MSRHYLQNPKSREIIESKIVLLGDSGVGKTSIALRYTQEESNFQQRTNPTIGASFLMKNLQIDDKKLKLQIWDTAGQERFRSLAPMYYRGASAALLVYDITSVSTYKKVKEWVNELKKNVQEDIIMVVVGNKLDRASDRQIPYEEAKEYALSVGASYAETSAKTKEGIESVFTEISQKIIHIYETKGLIENPEGEIPQEGNGQSVILGSTTENTSNDTGTQKKEISDNCCTN